jgi:ABC-type thiamin/hydroxymethylpyrimidine transport system permease subunit
MLALTLHQPTVAIITGVLLPFVVGLVTKYSSSARLKAIVNVVCAGIAAFIVRGTVDNGDFVFDQAWLLEWVGTFLVSIATYLGVYGHWDINAKLAPTVGLGPKEA